MKKYSLTFLLLGLSIYGYSQNQVRIENLTPAIPKNNNESVVVSKCFLENYYLIEEDCKIFQVSFYETGILKDKTQVKIILTTDSIYFAGSEIGKQDSLRIIKENKYVKNGVYYLYDELGIIVEQGQYLNGTKAP